MDNGRTYVKEDAQYIFDEGKQPDKPYDSDYSWMEPILTKQNVETL
jgi:hypothetical protein